MKQENSGMALNWNYVAVSVVVFASLALTILYMPAIKEVDTTVLHFVQSLLVSFPMSVPNFVSSFGYASHLLWPQIALGCVLLSHGKYLKAFLAIFFTQATFVSVCYIKDFIARERPTALAGYSFPSMHSALTMCFYGIVIYYIMRNVSNKFWKYFFVTIFSLWIFLVAISRLWLGVHYPIDVIAGLFWGFLMVNLFIIITKFFDRA